MTTVDLDAPVTDYLGRQHVGISGHQFTLINIIPFEDWVVKNYKSFSAFMDLKEKDRETIFLRWKWGLQDESSAELESSERQTLRMMHDAKVETMSPGVRYAIENKILFDRYCTDIRRRIGLIKQTREELTEPAQRALEVFGGEIA